MYQLRILGLLVIFLALGCNRPGREESSRPQDLIIGRWESDKEGIEFTTSGSVLVLGKKGFAQYQFLDDRTIEVSEGEQRFQVTGVSVSRDELSFIADGNSEKFQRVKDFSARLHAVRGGDHPAPDKVHEPEKAERKTQERDAGPAPPEAATQEPERPPPAKEPPPTGKEEQPLKKPNRG